MGSGSGGGAGGGRSGGTQTVVNEPWSAQRPYLTRGFARAGQLLNAGGPQYFPGQNWVNQSSQTRNALQNTWERATQGAPVMDEAGRMTLGTLRGDYLSPESNPYLRATYDNALQAALPSLNATFSMSGRTGAGAQSDALADTYGALGRDIYGQNYQAERDRQMKALIFAPQIAANDYADLQAQQQVGSAQDAQAQKVLNARMDRYNFNQNRPWDALTRYMGLVGGQQYGGSQTTQNPQYGGSALGGALGGGIAGAGLAQALPALGLTGPWGFGIGAGLGLLNELI